MKHLAIWRAGKKGLGVLKFPSFMRSTISVTSYL